MELMTSLANLSYNQTRTVAAPTPQGDGQAGGLVGMVESFAQTLVEGEAVAKAAMMGGADPHALIQALASSQTAVDTVATVRDKVVEAYQEILRMPV